MLLCVAEGCRGLQWAEDLDEAESWESIVDLVQNVRCVAVCCSVLQCFAVQGWAKNLDESESWQSIADLVLKVPCVAVCCRVLQCVAACCHVLQCVAVCHIVTWCVAECRLQISSRSSVCSFHVCSYV